WAATTSPVRLALAALPSPLVSMASACLMTSYMLRRSPRTKETQSPPGCGSLQNLLIHPSENYMAVPQSASEGERPGSHVLWAPRIGARVVRVHGCQWSCAASATLLTSMSLLPPVAVSRCIGSLSESRLFGRHHPRSPPVC